MLSSLHDYFTQTFDMYAKFSMWKGSGKFLKSVTHIDFI